MHAFDAGYGQEPFRTLCADYPDASVYPTAAFRTEWGPIFHRGRLDGTARVLVIGQDPATHESVARRILVGTAGHRLQGFLAKLGIDHSYAMINTFLYSLYGKAGGHGSDPAIIAYRNRWLDALLVGTNVEAVVSLGALADDAWNAWKSTPRGTASTVKQVKITHPTQPESSSGNDAAKRTAATKALLQNWNVGLQALAPLSHPDVARSVVPYGVAFKSKEFVEIPEDDLPPGLPAWMRDSREWAVRGDGKKAAPKRARITITAL